MKINDLRLKCNSLDEESDKIYIAIDSILDSTINYNGIDCVVIDFDLKVNYIDIYPSDGESVLSELGKNLRITFEEYDELK